MKTLVKITQVCGYKLRLVIEGKDPWVFSRGEGIPVEGRSHTHHGDPF